MSLYERQDWFSLARSIARCRIFGYYYYEIEGLSHILGKVGGSKTDASNSVFEFCEDYTDKFLDSRAICNSKLTGSGPCTCEWLDEPGDDCVAKYHLNAIPDLYFTIDQLVESCEKLNFTLNDMN